MVVWNITELKVKQSPEPNTVVEIAYTASHSDGPTRSGTVMLGPPGEPFIAYADLTEQTVLGWLWDFVSKDATETMLAAQTGQTKTEILPWGTKQ